MEEKFIQNSNIQKERVHLIEENDKLYFKFPDKKLEVIGIDKVQNDVIDITICELEDSSTQIRIGNNNTNIVQTLYLSKETLSIFACLLLEHTANREINILDIAKTLTLTTNYERGIELKEEQE